MLLVLTAGRPHMRSLLVGISLRSALLEDAQLQSFKPLHGIVSSAAKVVV